MKNWSFLFGKGRLLDKISTLCMTKISPNSRDEAEPCLDKRKFLHRQSSPVNI
jgi:hypothetical protein